MLSYRQFGNAVVVTIGERIEARLADLQWSQSKLARTTGLSQTTINSMIRRGARMTPHLGRIATALQTSTAYLTGEVDDPDLDAPEPPLLTPQQDEWLKLFNALDAPNRAALVQIARTMVTGMNSPTVNSPKHAYRGEE